jgi:molybdopterin molybdotransferase
MIPFEQACEVVMERSRTLPVETVTLEQALCRVLAEDAVSDVDMPPFDKSAMDGYACRRQDLGNALKVVETIPAGCVPTRRIGANECAKIMTGAPAPQGADCVIMVEYTESAGDGAVRFTGKETRANICARGEDVRTGDVVLRRGVRLGPEHLAVLATVGCAEPKVYARARVGVIATGDELVEHGKHPSEAQIRNSNSPQLCAQVLAAGAIPKYYGIARDTERDTALLLRRALDENDVVLLSGGVSAGDYDVVPGVMRELGVEILFDSVAIKPGKPSTFGVTASGYCFGLPGNPVSTYILFEVLVRPFLRRLMGEAEPRTVTYPLRLAEPLSRKGGERAAWIPVRITPEGEVAACEFHGSAHIHALCMADGLIMMPPGVTTLAKGAEVHVRPLRA